MFLVTFSTILWTTSHKSRHDDIESCILSGWLRVFGCQILKCCADWYIVVHPNHKPDTKLVAIVHPESPWTKDASGRLIFWVQTHADTRRRRRTHADERRRMQNSSAAFYVQAFICLGLESLSLHQSLSYVGSFLRSRNTVGTWSIVSETPPTNLSTQN